MNETLATFTNKNMQTIIPDTVIESPKTELERTYIEKKSIDEAIHQELWNKDVYKI